MLPQTAEGMREYFESVPMYWIVVNGRYDIANCGDPYTDYAKADKEFKRLVSERLKRRKTSQVYEIKMVICHKGKETTKFSAQFGISKK